MKLVQELLRRHHKKHYLSEAEMREVARLFSVPFYRVQEVVSFFPHFRTEKPPQLQVAVCRDMSCRLNGSEDVCTRIRDEFGDDPDVELHEVSCLGRCDRAPAAFVNDENLYVKKNASEMTDIVRSYKDSSPVAADQDAGCTTGNRDDWQIDPYQKPDDRYKGSQELHRES